MNGRTMCFNVYVVRTISNIHELVGIFSDRFEIRMPVCSNINLHFEINVHCLRWLWNSLQTPKLPCISMWTCKSANPQAHVFDGLRHGLVGICCMALKYALSLMTAIKFVIDFRCAKYMFGLIFIYCTCAPSFLLLLLLWCTEMRTWKIRRNREWRRSDMLTLRTWAVATSLWHSFDYRISHVIIGLRLNRYDNLYCIVRLVLFCCCYFYYLFLLSTYASLHSPLAPFALYWTRSSNSNTTRRLLLPRINSN